MASNPAFGGRGRISFDVQPTIAMPKRIPLETRLYAIKLHREQGLSTQDAAKVVGVGHRSVQIWLKKYPEQPSANTFSPIVLDDATTESLCDATSGMIPVTVSIPDGTTLQLQLSNLDDVTRLIRSLNNTTD